MKLVKVSENILVNPECISSVEQKIVHSKKRITVLVEGRSYTLEVSIEEFMKELNSLNASTGQHFAG